MNSQRTSLNQSVQLQAHSDGTLSVWLETPNRSVNVLDAHMLEGLEAAAEHIEATPDRYSAVVFRSGKENCFFVGADVQAIEKIASESQAQVVIKRGQQLMTRIENLPMPTVAAIRGACMGGGLELAIACDFRIALDSPETKLGLPEIKLGLIPGWGGTQRMPKLVGLRQALKMILTGKTLDSRKAVQFGLIDEKISPEDWDSKVSKFVSQISSDQDGASKHCARLLRLREGRHSSWASWMLERNPVGRSIVFRTAQRQIGSRHQHYPALGAAIAAVRAACATGGRAYEKERIEFARLLFTDTARSLIGLFVARDRARKATTWISESKLRHSNPIKSVAVVGAGAMGAGIGTLAALKGHRVVFKEIHEGAADAGRVRAEEILRSQLNRKRISELQLQQAMDRMLFTSDWSDTANCDLAIEAVLEIETVKREVFEMLDRSLPSGSTLASNTSSLCVTRLATSTKRREKVAGLYFFNPVDRMDLVEIVRTESTDDATMMRSLEFVRTLGKTPIVTSDKPGFLVNRVLFPYLGEAIRMVGEGYDVHQIDKQMRDFGMPMGPLELIDQIGVDIAHHVAQSQAEIQPEAGVPLLLLSQMVESGWLGKKSGIGFYDYAKTTSKIANELIPREAVAPKVGLQFAEDRMSKVQRRLIYPILNEAVHCLDELVVGEAWIVDLGMVLGTGFAPQHGGPLRLIDRIGPVQVLQNMRELADNYGSRFKPADGLEMTAKRKENFFGSSPTTLTWEKDNESRYSTQS